MTLPRCWIDAEKCHRGIEALKQYSRDFDEKGKTWRGRPKHDWTSHACFSGETLIKCVDGKKRIDQIVVGDQVTLGGVTGVVTDQKFMGVKRVINLELSNGENLRVTPDHKIFTTRGLVRADSLRYNDTLITEEYLKCLPYQSVNTMGLRAAFIESTNQSNTGTGQSDLCTSRKQAVNTECYIELSQARQKVKKHYLSTVIGKTLTQITGRSGVKAQGVKNTQNTLLSRLMAALSILGRTTATMLANGQPVNLCIGMSGSTTTDPYQKGTTFTTKTTTNLTTQSKTLSSYPIRSTQDCTQKQTHGSDLSKTNVSFSKFKTKLNFGTRLKKVVNGIVTTLRRFGKTNQKQRNSVCFANPTTKPITPTDQSFAPLTVERITEGGSCKVYDLTVNLHHAYSANGVIVSNCDSLRYMFTGYRSKSGWSGGALKRGLKGVA